MVFVQRYLTAVRMRPTCTAEYKQKLPLLISLLSCAAAVAYRSCAACAVYLIPPSASGMGTCIVLFDLSSP